MATLKRKHTELQHQTTGEHELLDQSRSLSKADAHRVLDRLRNKEDVKKVLRYSKNLPPSGTEAGPLLSTHRNRSALESIPIFRDSAVSRALTLPSISHHPDRLPRVLTPGGATLGVLESFTGGLPSFDTLTASLGLGRRVDVPPQSRRGADEGSPNTPDLQSGSGPVARNVPTHMSDGAHLRLYDSRLGLAKASDWGIRYVADHDFRSILSYYFSWDHPFLHWFDEEDFLEGITYRTSEVTSPLCLTVVLAWAALSKNDRSLATAAAGIIMHWLLGANSADRLGVAYCSRALEIMSDFGLHDAQRANEIYRNVAPATSRTRAALAWGSYNSASTMEVSCRAGVKLPKPPPVPMPSPGSEYVHDSWVPWPAQRPQFDVHTHEITTARSNLYIIVTDMIFLQRRFLKFQLHATFLLETLVLHRRFKTWFDTLPPELTASESTTPQVLILHLLYHHMIVALFGPFTAHPSSSSPSSIPLLSAQLPIEPAVSAVIVAGAQLRDLLDRLAVLYPTSPLHANLIPLAMTVAFATAPSASATSITYHPSTRKSFLTAFHLLRRIAAAIPLVYFALVGLQQAAVRSNFSLPAEVEQELKELRKEKIAVEELKSDWVVDVRKWAKDDDTGRLDTLIKEMGEVDLRDNANRDDSARDGPGPGT